MEQSSTTDMTLEALEPRVLLSAGPGTGVELPLPLADSSAPVGAAEIHIVEPALSSSAHADPLTSGGLDAFAGLLSEEIPLSGPTNPSPDAAGGSTTPTALPVPNVDVPSGPGVHELVLHAGDVVGGEGSATLDLVNLAGVVSPGHSPGVFTANSYTQGKAGTQIIQITNWNAANSPVVYDQFISSGNVSLDGTLNIQLSGFTPVIGQTFPILKWGGVRVGQFSSYLGTTVPGNNQLALVPEYDDVAKELRLRVVNTQAVVPELENAIQGVSDIVGNLFNLSLPGATSLPLIGSSIKNLIDGKQMVENTIKAKLASLINTLPTQAQVTKELEGLNLQTFGNFQVLVASVLGHYSQPGDPKVFYSWDILLTVKELKLTQLVSTGLNKVFDFAFGPGSNLTLQDTLELDFTLGYDDVDGNPLTPNAFLDLRSVTARTQAVAKNLNPLQLTPPWLLSTPVSNIGVSGSIAFEAFVTFTPDPNTFPSGHWLAAIPPVLPDFSAFTTTKGSSLDATLTLNASLNDPANLWASFTLFKYEGIHTLHIVDTDLFDNVKPDVTLVIDGKLRTMGQELQGVFTLTKSGASSDIAIDAAISNLDLRLTVGAGPSLRVLKASGHGNFLLKANGDLGGVASLTVLPGNGPEVPNIDDLSGTFALTFNSGSSVTTVPLPGNTSVDIPGGGPYYRIDGTNVTLDLGVPDLVLHASKFTFEPVDTTPGNLNDDQQEVVVAVQGLAFDFTVPGNHKLVSVSNGDGVMLFTRIGADSGIVAQITSATVGVDLVGVATLTGQFGVAINDFGQAINRQVKVLGQTKTLDVQAGKFLRVEAKTASLSLLPGQTGNALTVTGNFAFEKYKDPVAGEFVTLAFNQAHLPFLDGGAQQVVILDNISGIFVSTEKGIAGQATVGNFQFGVPGVIAFTLNPNSDVSLQINTTDAPVQKSVQLGAQTVSLNVDAGPFVRFRMLKVNLTIANFNAITGDFGFEQRQSSSGQQMITVAARNVSFNLGPVQPFFGIRDGNGLFIINNGQFAGAAEVVLDVIQVPFLNLDDGDPAPGIKLSFGFNNNALTAINEVFNFGSSAFTGSGPSLVSSRLALARAPVAASAASIAPATLGTGLIPVKVPAGNFFQVQGPMGISFTAGGGVERLSGVFTLTNVDSGGQHFVGVKARDLTLKLTAGSTEVISFRNGVGQFAIFQDGFGGTASLDFESGIINVGGDISLELNTTNHGLLATQGGYSINLTQSNDLKIAVDGFIAVGPGSFPFTFSIESNFATQEVVFRQSGQPPGQFLAKVTSAGSIVLGTLPALPDFSQVSEGEFLPLIKQFINWLDQFRTTSPFEAAIPFTGGKTLGDVLDYANWFIANVYPKLASVELRSVAAFNDASGNPLPLSQLPLSGSYPAFSFHVQLGKYAAGTNEPIAVTVPAGTFTTAAQLAANLNLVVAAATAGRVVSRINKEGRPVLAISDTEIVNNAILILTLDGTNNPFQSLGFGNNQNAIEVERAPLGDMIQAFALALGLSPPAFDANKKVYTFPVSINQNLASLNLPFQFAQSLGLIADASLTGSLTASANLQVGMTIGFDFSAVEVPMVLTSPLVPVPSNGHLSANAHFDLFLNGDPSPIGIDLLAADTAGFTRLEHLVNYINSKFAAKTYLGQPLDHWVIARKAGQSIAFTALQEDRDGDKHFDSVNEDVNRNNKLDPGEDLDGDGRLDLNEDANNNRILDPGEDINGDNILNAGEDLNGDGLFENRLGVINLIVMAAQTTNTAATELGIGTDAVKINGSNYLVSAAKSSIKGLFIDNAHFGATVNVAGAASGQIRIGFLDVSVLAGSGFQTSPAIKLDLDIRDSSTGRTRFYIPELMNGLGALDHLVANTTLTGGFNAQLKLGLDPALGILLPANANIGILIPDITNLTFNTEPYAPGKTGTFLTYSGLNGIENFSDVGFLQVLQALRAVVDTLSKLQSFGFLDQQIPFIEVSLSDMLNWADKVGQVVDGVAGGNPRSLQKMIDLFQARIEDSFHISGRNQNIFKLTVDDVPNPLPQIVSGNVEALFNADGTNNGLKFKANGTSLSGARIEIIGSSDASGGLAIPTWDASTKTLRIKIDSGVTTANAILAAVNALGSPWSVSLTEGGGTGPVSRTAIRVHLNFTTAYGQSIPLQVNLEKLLGLITGDNSPAAKFLSDATTFIHLEGNGLLNVSASAGVVLDFGLDLTNPTGIKPFLYDTTKASLKLEVLGSDLEFEASLGSVVGIFVKHGTVTLDADGDPDTQGKAELALGFKDNNGDNRHYFSENLFASDSFGFTTHAGLTADLPIYAPTEGTPLGTGEDKNGDGYPDNHLVVDIPDLLRLFIPDQAAGTSATIPMRGNNNDFIVTTSDPAKANFTVVFVNDPGTAPKAQYNAGSKTLTLTISSGVTTTQQIIAKIGADAPTFTATLTADDDGNSATTTNSGSGKLVKTIIATPDFSQLFANLDLCAILDHSAGLFLNGLDKVLGFIQDGLDNAVSAVKLPLIGDGLSGTAHFIRDFREGLLADLREAIAKNGGSAAEAMKSALQQVFWKALGKPGADLLVDPVTGAPITTYQQIDVQLDCDNGLQVNLRLHKALFNLDTGDALKIDLGVPGFGLKLDGNLQVQLAFDFKFGFGLNKKDGFYFVTDWKPALSKVNTNDVNSSAMGSGAELFLGFSITPKFSGSAELFFLQLDVQDMGSFFRGGFEIDLKDPNNDGKLTFAELSSPGLSFGRVFEPRLGAQASVNLHAALSFGGNAAFPRVLANFHLDWAWDIQHGQDGPHINFDDIYLDLGSYISDFLGPVLGKIREFTKPIDPILDMVTTPLPIISDLLGKPITFLDLAESFGYLDAGTRKFIVIADQVVDLIQLIGNFNGKSLLIPMGAFELIAGVGGEAPHVNPTGELLKNFDQDLESIKNANPGAGSTEVNETIGFTKKLDASVFHFPIWENPSAIFGLFTGQPVSLIEVRLPTFKFEFTYVQKIPIYGPLFARFGGTVGAELTFGFGYDTYGIQKFISSSEKNAIDIFDGFYIIDFDAAGHERPEVRLYGEIFAGASIDLGVAEAGVEGGVRVTVDFDLNDFNNDGRVRISELISLVQIDPLCIFNVHGTVDLFLRAFLKVNLLLFTIDAEWEFLTVTLFSFDFTCQMPEPASQSGNVLTLNMGDDAAKRLALDTSDGAERFVVTHIRDDAGGETVEVNWEGFVKEFNGVKKIYVKNAGEKGDYIDLRGTKAAIDIRLGDGDDTILLGDGGGFVDGGNGNDTITGGGAGLEIHGGAGRDTILVYGKAVVFGDDGADDITGSDDDDKIYGGGGNDRIFSGLGNDVVEGGGGNDYIDAGPGDDVVRGDDGADEIHGGDGNDVLYGGNGDDLLLGGSGNDVLVGGNGNDQLYGHSGLDLLIGSTAQSWSTDWISNPLLIPVSGVNVTGIGSGDDAAQTDDDFLIGGGNSDFLFGGRGNDFLFGGNFFSKGHSDVVEEDDNDFIDGGTGDDQLFGDDAQGKTGDRDTGIAVESTVWLDMNGNSIRDEGEKGAAGVTVEIYSPSDPTFHDKTVTKADGSFKFTGLDPDKYFLVFTSPYDTGTGKGLKLVEPNKSDNESIDSDAVAADPAKPHVGTTQAFTLHVNETLTTVSAGVIGDVVLSITDASVQEGQTGSRPMNFTVNLSRGVDAPVSFRFRAIDATAVSVGASKDYFSRGGTVTFEPGERSKTVSVTVLGDSVYEGRYEQFQVILDQLTFPTTDPVFFSNGGQISLSATGTIIGDDGPPQLSISDAVPEVQGGAPATEGTPATFTVRLSNPSATTVTVQWKTVDAAAFEADGQSHYATAGSDYLAGGGTLTFLPGETEKSLTVKLLQDSVDEYDERFFVELYNAQKALVADGHGVGIIADDDAPVDVNLGLNPIDQVPGLPNTTEVFEGGTATFKVSLSAPSGKDINVSFATSQGTAVSALPIQVMLLTGERPDFVFAPDPSVQGSSQSLHFAPGETEKTIVVKTLNQDVFPEPVETFFLNLVQADNAVIAGNHGVIRIRDTDTGSADAGISPISFAKTHFYVHEYDPFAEITLIKTAGVGIATAVFSTQDLTATNGLDYGGGTFVVTFAANEFVKTVQIPIKPFDDRIWEGSEDVKLTMRGFTGKPANAAPYAATLTILDDESEPEVFLVEPSLKVTEGTDPKAVFVLRSLQDYSDIKVYYKTVDLTATAGSDYTPQTGSVTLNVIIDAYYSEAVIEIPIKDDLLLEAPESFGLLLTGIEHGTLKETKGTVLIRDNEKDTVQGYVFLDANNNGFFDFNERGMKDVVVTLTDGNNNVLDMVATDADGKYTAQASQGTIVVNVSEISLTEKNPIQSKLKFYTGFELTTGNDSQSIHFLGGSGLELFTPIGYRPKSLSLGAVDAAEPAGRGGTDDTLFGGPGNDFIDAGAGDDHVVGGHWQTATNHWAPINQGVYDAKIVALDPLNPPPGEKYDWLRPLNGLIFDVNTTGMGNNATVSGTVKVQPNNQPLAPYADMTVNLLDDKGNVVDAIKTTGAASGNYLFDGVFPGKYQLEFVVPPGYSASAGVDPDTFRSPVFTLNDTAATPDYALNLTIQPGPQVPTSDTVVFHKPTYIVAQGEVDSFAVIKLVRGDATRREAVVLATEQLKNVPDAAIDGQHYTGVRTLVNFEIGQYERVITIPILAKGDIAECQSVELQLDLYSATGERLGNARLFIKDVAGAIEDNDTIRGGDDWDIILGDSGHIPSRLHPGRFLQPAPGDPNPPPVLDPYKEIKFSGGPGDDSIQGGRNIDRIFGQGGQDLIDGGYGTDIIDAGLGNDIIAVGWGDDIIDGNADRDTLESTRDADQIVKKAGGPGGTDLLTLDLPGVNFDTSITFKGIEHIKLVGGVGDNTFTLTNWSGSAELVGFFGTDRVVVDNDTNMTLKDGTGEILTLGSPVAKFILPSVSTASASEDAPTKLQILGQATSAPIGMLIGVSTANTENAFLALAKFLNSQPKASLTLGNGSLYTLTGVETAKLVGGPSANRLDASQFSGDVIFQGKGGDDEMLGGKGNDTFVFTTDDTGTDTLTGNADGASAASDKGFDTLDFTALTQDLTVDIHILNTPKTVWAGAPLSLIFGDEDLDAILGGSGNDTLTGNARDNLLLGGPGNDILVGREGSETYAFDADLSWGTETVIEDPADLTGHDVLDFSRTDSFPVVLNLNLGTPQVIGNLTLILGAGGFEEVIGGSKNDTLTGNAAANTLRGGPGDDTLIGLGGDDLFDGGLGFDTLVGGTGVDTLIETANVDFTLNDANLFKSDGQIEALSGIEKAILTGGLSANTFTLTGWSGNAVLDGGGHVADRFVLTASADFKLLDLGTSNVRLELDKPVADSVADQTVDLLNIERFELSGGPTDDTLDGSLLSANASGQARGSFTFKGGAGNDHIIGTIWDDILLGGAGDDVLDGNLGNDQIDGGSGSGDRVEVVRDAELFLLLNGSIVIDQDTATPESEMDTVVNVENVKVTGGPSDNTFDATGWTTGEITIDGAGQVGVDIVRTSGDGDFVLTDGWIQRSGSTGKVNLLNIERALLTGGSGDNRLDASQFSGQAILSGLGGDDVLIGGSGTHILRGGDGNDTLISGKGSTRLDGGAGDDTYVFDADNPLGSDLVIDAGGTDTLDFSSTNTVSITLDLGLASAQVLNVNLTLQLLGAASIENVKGTAKADVITGNDLDNQIEGGKGQDIINGGLGNDVLIGDEDGDALFGGDGNDTLVGGAGDDQLDGGAGSDTYEFDADKQLGSDKVIDSAGLDTLDFSKTQSVSLVVNLSISVAQVVNTNLTLTLVPGTQIENLIGGDKDDKLIGNGLANIITGGRGNDTIDGAGGTDTVREVRDADVTLTDTKLKIGTEIDDLFNVEQAIITGGASNNRMDASQFTGRVAFSGMGGVDKLIGGSGNDILSGGDDSDLLFGGSGDDVLAGGAGNDLYVFDQSVAQGKDTIVEQPGQGADTLVGVKPVTVDLTSTAAQIVSPTLTLTLQTLNVEFVQEFLVP